MKQAQARQPSPLDRLLSLELKVLWTCVKKAPAALLVLWFYVMVEYLRPHHIYPQLQIVPFGQLVLTAALVTWAMGPPKLRKLRLMDGMVAVFFGLVLVSAMSAWSPELAWSQASTAINWIILYVLVSMVVVTPLRGFLFWLGFFLINLKMSQHGTRAFVGRGFSFADWGATGSPGWFQNSGEFALQMLVFIGMSWYLLQELKPRLSTKKYTLLVALLPGTAVLSVLASSSRGGQIGFAVLVLFAVLRSRRAIRAAVAGVAVVGVLWMFVLPAEQKQRFDIMGDDETSQARLTYWEHGLDVIEEHPATGIGYNNWIQYYRTHYDPRGEEVHNTFIEAGAEIGIPGGLVFIFMILLTFRMNYRTRQRVAALRSAWGGVLQSMSRGLDAGMVGMMVASFFMSVLFYPVYWMAFALTVGIHAAAEREWRREVALRRKVAPAQQLRVPAVQAG